MMIKVGRVKVPPPLNRRLNLISINKGLRRGGGYAFLLLTEKTNLNTYYFFPEGSLEWIFFEVFLLKFIWERRGDNRGGGRGVIFFLRIWHKKSNSKSKEHISELPPSPRILFHKLCLKDALFIYKPIFLKLYTYVYQASKPHY